MSRQTVKLSTFVRYPFSYFWLETGSYELIFVLSRASKQNYIENQWPQDKITFSSGIKAGPPPPLEVEAILVIFGRRALIFFLFESSWKKMKNDTTFVRMRSGDHLGDAKCRKRAPRSVEFNFFINCDRHKRFLQNERRRVDLPNVASDFLIFA